MPILGLVENMSYFTPAELPDNKYYLFGKDGGKQLAEKYIKELDASGAWNKPIITEVTPFTKFYAAENYHQNYYNDNTNQGYCRYVIGPKLEKFEKVFKDKLKHD